MRDNLSHEPALDDTRDPGDGQTVAQLALLIVLVVIGAAVWVITETGQ